MAFFRERVEVEPEGARPWEHMTDLSYEGTSYSAWRRPTPTGRTEYKSITITPNATAEEFMDFYLDDPTRPKWDDMIKGAGGGGPVGWLRRSIDMKLGPAPWAVLCFCCLRWLPAI